MARKTNYTKNGIDYFRVTASIGRDSNGKPIRKEFYGKSKKEAEEKRDEYLNGIKSGLNVDFKNATLGALMHTWLFEIVRVDKDIKPPTFERYEGIYRNYIKDSEIYGCKLNNLKSIQLQRYYNKLFENNKTSNQIKNLNKLLKTFFNYAIEEGYLLKNPCSSKGRKKLVIPGNSDIKLDEEEDIVVFSNQEIDLLKKALENHRLKALILLDLGTGLRLGELLALQWSDISEEFTELKVQRSIKEVSIIKADGSREYTTIIQTPKTPSSIRTVPIPSSLVSVIKDHQNNQKKEKLKAGESYKNEGFVFTTELGKTIGASNLRKTYKRLLNKAGVEYRKFHGLRHTYITKLFEAGVPLKTVQKLAGHSNISTTANFYIHVMPKEKITAVEKLNNLFA